MSHFQTLFSPRMQAILSKCALGFAFLLVAILSFEAGWLKKSLGEVTPIMISIPASLAASALPKPVVLPGGVQENSVPVGVTPPTSETNCAFVGSKNSNKYHLPTSRCAKQIKPENMVCFASPEAAKEKGYVAGCLE